MSGKAFTIRKTEPGQGRIEAHLVSPGMSLSRADLEQPSCPACFRPGKEQGYCAKCEMQPEDGSDSPAERHRAARRRPVVSAPLPPTPATKRHDKRNRVAPETLLAALQAYVQEHGVVPTRGAWERAHQLPSYASAYRLYGSWGAALQAAGLEAPR